MANDRDVRIDGLLDRQDIVDCLTRMSRGADRLDRDLFLSAFHADAVIAAGDFVGSPEELADWAFTLQDMVHEATFHNLLNHSFDIDGDTAHVETYYLYAAKNRNATNLLAGGRYIDRFEKRDGAWKLLVRNNLVEWSSIVDALPSPVGEGTDIALNGIALRNRQDPSYARPLENHRARRVPPLG